MKEAGARGKSDTGRLSKIKRQKTCGCTFKTCMNGKWGKLRKGEKAGNNHIRWMLRRKCWEEKPAQKKKTSIGDMLFITWACEKL